PRPARFTFTRIILVARLKPASSHENSPVACGKRRPSQRMCCWSVTTGPTDARPASDSVRSAMAADVFTNLFVARLLARRICRSIEQHVYKALGLRREDAPFAQHHAIA